MTCDICGKKKATVHLTEIVESKPRRCTSVRNAPAEKLADGAAVRPGRSFGRSFRPEQDTGSSKRAKRASLNVRAADCLMRISVSSAVWAAVNVIHPSKKFERALRKIHGPTNIWVKPFQRISPARKKPCRGGSCAVAVG